MSKKGPKSRQLFATEQKARAKSRDFCKLV